MSVAAKAEFDDGAEDIETAPAVEPEQLRKAVVSTTQLAEGQLQAAKAEADSGVEDVVTVLDEVEPKRPQRQRPKMIISAPRLIERQLQALRRQKDTLGPGPGAARLRTPARLEKPELLHLSHGVLSREGPEERRLASFQVPFGTRTDESPALSSEATMVADAGSRSVRPVGVMVSTTLASSGVRPGPAASSGPPKVSPTDTRSRNFFGTLQRHLTSAKKHLAVETNLKRKEAPTLSQEPPETQELRRRLLEDAARDEREKAAWLEQAIRQKESVLHRKRQREEDHPLEEPRSENQRQLRIPEESGSLQERLETHYSLMMNFIRTKAEPTIFYLPVEHNPQTEKLLEETRSAIRQKVESLKDHLWEDENGDYGPF